MDKAKEMRRKIRMNKPYFPLFIDIAQKEIVVIGGGRIAERRVKTLLSFAEHIAVYHHLRPSIQYMALQLL